MRFAITVSLQNFTEKPTGKEIQTMEYVVKSLSLDEIIAHIRNGYTLSANYTTDYKSIIRQQNRRNENLIGTSYVMFDLDDDIKCSLSKLIENLVIKPTIAYTTFSHQKEGKGNRYRLLYFFKEEIMSVNLYRELYDIIRSENNLSVTDGCGRNISQAVLGSYTDCELINTDVVYSINQFNLNNSNIENGLSNSIRNERRSNIKIECPIQDEEYKTDYWNIPLSELIEKYNGKYHFFQHTPIREADEDTPYVILPSNFIEIKRYWVYSIDYNKHGEERGRTSKARRIKDGEGRKKKLFINGVLRRLMIDGLTFEHLLHCLVNELYYYIDNSTDFISKKQLFEIAKSSYNANLKRYGNINSKIERRKFIVNDKYCIKYNLTKRQVRNISKKYLTFNKIEELFDMGLTDKANIEVFNEYGLNISEKTLQRFRKEMGITKYKKGNGHSISIKEKKRSNIEIESPIQNWDKPYYDYQSELLLQEMDEDVNDGFYDIGDTDDLKAMIKIFMKRAKNIYPNYINKELILMFKRHYQLAS